MEWRGIGKRGRDTRGEEAFKLERRRRGDT